MKRHILLSALFTAMAATAVAQTLPLDPAVRTGKLKNGMTYYLRHNAKEAGLADFYIAQRVGSIQEEPRQRGLAHFLEHMAFNGTKNFPGKGNRLGIVPWCETIGVKFGANLNAYTSVEQTVYHIGSAPLKREGIIDSCLLVLHDWSHYLLLEDAEIDKERGVIHEEWRTRRAGRAVSRLMEQAIPKVYKGTKYEDCMPIGSMDIVDHFPYQDLRDYYHKWYRPDLQAIIVVGDIDVNRMEQKVKKLFSAIPLPKNRAERIYYPVNDNDTMIVDIEKDTEQPIVLCHLYQKRDATPDSQKNQESYLRADYADRLVSNMLNDRLAELRQQPVPPFQSATARASEFFLSRTKEAFSLSVSCRQDNILGGIIAAVGVAERARQHGFTQAELERAKKLYLNTAERRYNQRNDYRNSHYVSQCVSHFLNAEPLLSAEQDMQLARKFYDEVTLDEVNKAARELITDRNQVAIMYAPDKEDFPLPTEKQIEEVILAAQAISYAPTPQTQLQGPTLTQYVDSLLSAAPTAETQRGAIVSERAFGNNGFRELTLSNGMKVYVKKTDYSADAVTFNIKADGGTSVYADADIPNFSLLTSAVTEAGIGPYDATTLRRMLAGKSVRISPSVDAEQQAVSGTSSVKDMETWLQLAYLYFTQPRRDTTAYQALVSRTHAFLANRNASPRVDYNDSIKAILYQHHPRMEPVTQQTLLKANYDRILQIYRERFSDASNFKAVIIGNYDEQQLRQAICRYLATLPSTHKNEQTNRSNLPKMAGGKAVHRFTKKMATPLANVSIYYTADLPFSPQTDLQLDFLKRALSIAYTDSVREEKGGTYGVSVDFNLEKTEQPNAMLRISYNADPQRYEELNPIIYQQLKNMAEHGPAASTMKKIKEYLVKQYDQVRITNDYWSYIAWHEIDDEADFDRNYCQMVNDMQAADVQRIARQLLDSNRCIEVTMLSE